MRFIATYLSAKFVDICESAAAPMIAVAAHIAFMVLAIAYGYESVISFAGLSLLVRLLRAIATRVTRDEDNLLVLKKKASGRYRRNAEENHNVETT
ncbi:MAG: hypothetical protein IPK01_00845 [Acidobacteria bacterium]|nr:hypothetical protein [Acidobacteriota bacterium]